MAVKKRKPTSPGRRFQTVSDFAEITTDRPEKTLISKKAKTGGRNTQGRVTSRHRGGGRGLPRRGPRSGVGGARPVGAPARAGSGRSPDARGHVYAAACPDQSVLSRLPQ